MKRSALFVVLITLLWAGVTSAQSNDVTSPLVMLLSPEYPSPNSSAVVEVKSISVNLGSAAIAWLENGKLIESGIGKTKHSFRTGRLGSVLTITVIARTQNGTTYENSLVIRPASVDLVWESLSTTIPFYKGKSLYPRFGNLKIIALPEVIDSDGVLIPASELSYVWTRDDEVLGNYSGFGRNSLQVTEPVYRTPVTIGVTVSTKDGVSLASNAVEVDTYDPAVLLYENNPLYGILFNRTVQNFNLVGSEITLEAYPLTMKAENRGSLTYEWNSGGIPVTGFSGPSITFRNTNNQSGVSSVGLTVSNPQVFSSPASVRFNITYGNNGQ